MAKDKKPARGRKQTGGYQGGKRLGKTGESSETQEATPSEPAPRKRTGGYQHGEFLGGPDGPGEGKAQEAAPTTPVSHKKPKMGIVAKLTGRGDKKGKKD